MCSDKNCQKHINMWPVMPEMNMQLPKLEVLYQYRRLCNDKNCQSIRCSEKKNYDKNCQSYVKSESEGSMLFSYADSNENKWHDCK